MGVFTVVSAMHPVVCPAVAGGTFKLEGFVFKSVGIAGRVSPSEASNVLSDFWIMDTSYLRMKTIQLGYTLPKNWIEKWGIQNLRVYYSAENLLTFDDMPINVDPETVSERLSSYPLNKTHSFGVNITF